ncbi:hypothetical protein E2C01_065097 [Portunus trituberculatus]|uniref:Uncharacterized protein n=1 Tax=Portunus trituberculatus TaxID=210409 RepID=A0A5B7HLL9_PORTR|nr:hypothetical protein [Portunus trituberculatus]
MYISGTAIALAFDAAAGRTLPAFNTVVSIPDIQSIDFTHRAIVALDTASCGLLKLINNLESLF